MPYCDSPVYPILTLYQDIWLFLSVCVHSVPLKAISCLQFIGTMLYTDHAAFNTKNIRPSCTIYWKLLDMVHNYIFALNLGNYIFIIIWYLVYFQFSPLIQDTVLKGTFNATLNNPIAPQLDMSQHMGTTAKHAFLLGVWTRQTNQEDCYKTLLQRLYGKNKSIGGLKAPVII
jgi:hypothetical protein